MEQFCSHLPRVTSIAATVISFALIIVLGAGFVVDALFERRLKRFVNGKELCIELGFRRTYRLVTIALVLLLYGLLAFSVLTLVDLVAGIWFVAAGRFSALILASWLLAGASLWALFKGLIGRTAESVSSVAIDRVSEPEVRTTCDAVAGKVDTKPADEIRVRADADVSVHIRGGLLNLMGGTTKRILTIGLAFAATATTGEFEAILAHEFGHFSNRDTEWGRLTQTVRATVVNALIAMPKPGTGGWLLYYLLSYFNPAFWLLILYTRIFAFVTAGFRRVQEVLADKVAVERYGSDSFCSGLVKHARVSAAVGSYARMVTQRSKQPGFRQPIDAIANILSVLSYIETHHGADLSQALISGTTSIYDTHPPLSVRTAYAKRFAIAGDKFADERPATSLFADWPAICRAASARLSTAAITG